MPLKKQIKNGNGKKPNKGRKPNNRVRKICSEMRKTEPEPQPFDPMDDPLYRYRQPKLIDFDKLLDPDPHFPEGNIVILMKLLKKKPIPGVSYGSGSDYDWYGL